MLTRWKQAVTGLPAVLAILTVGYFFVAGWLGLLLRFDFMRSDVSSYWQSSQTWSQSFHLFHVPGYPILIDILRRVTLGVFPPLGYLMAINLVAFLGSAVLVYRCVIESGLSRGLAACSALAFGLWPFVGLVYTVYPLADLPAMFLLLAGVYALIRRRTLIGALFLGLSLIFHKAMWPVVALIVLFHLFNQRPIFSRERAFAFLLLISPLFLVWQAGVASNHNPLWIINSNLEVEMAPRGDLPLLDGIVGAFREPGVRGLLKGAIIGGLGLSSILLLAANLKVRSAFTPLGIAVSAAILALFIVLNQYEIWAAVRFSRLLVLPLAWVIGYGLVARKPAWFKPAWLAPLFLLAFLTQLAYAFYMARLYFNG